MTRILLGIGLVALLAGCATTSIETAARTDERPEGAAPNTCWAKQIKPAVIQTTITQTAIPGDEGETIYQTETQQSIVQEREEVWFEVPCQNIMDREFIASVQRGLQARGFYNGAITGVLDARTAKAIRLFQVPLGIDSQVLSILGAQRLGLVTTPIL